MTYLGEAFKKLDFLNEDDFSLSGGNDIDDMSHFLTLDDVTQEVIDADAENEDELQDSYVGKVILCCPVCHSMVYKDVEDIVHDDEDEDVVNIGEECPFCYSSEGFKIIGLVAPVEEVTEEEETEEPDEPDEEEVEDDIESDEEDNTELDEDLESVEVKTEDEVVSVEENEEGGVCVETTPIEEAEEAEPAEQEEVIVPLSDEEEDAIEDIVDNNSEEVEDIPEDEVDYDIEEFDEDSFDELGESYLKEVYNNVNSYKTSSVSIEGNKMIIEGIIKFNSGKGKKTQFVFESSTANKKNKLRFIGENRQITRGRRAFSLTGSLNEEKKFITEKLNYNYMTKNSEGNSTRLYGTVKK